MKNKTFFSIILIGAIFLPLSLVIAYIEIGPKLEGGSAVKKEPVQTINEPGQTINEPGQTINEPGGTINEPGGQKPESGSQLLSFGGLSLSQFFYNLQLYVWIIFTTLAILMFVFAGFLFLVAQGQPEKLKTARTAFIWGIVGAVIAILAYTIRAIIGGIFNF